MGAVNTFKKTAVLALVCMLCTLCGCETITFSIDSLLAAPSIADEQAAVHDALIESVGGTVVPSYPRSGDYRSAFIITDIDADGNDEALAFYTLSSQSSTQNVRVSVLDKTEDGGWDAMYELAGSGTYVDTVMLADYGSTVDIIIGYGSPASEDKSVCIYRYTSGVLASIYEGAYTVIGRWDLDGCGADETVIVRKVGTSVSVSTIKTLDGLDYQTRERNLSVSASYISGCCYGELYDGVNALFIDAVTENATAFTEIVMLDGDTIVSPTSDSSGLLERTARPYGYRTMDYDGDGDVEIPVISPFLGYSALTQSDIENITLWLSYDPELRDFYEEAQSYYNVSGGYIFKLPGRWHNFVTVQRNADTNEITFLKYDYTAQSISEMEGLLSIAVLPTASEQAYENNGYVYIDGTDYVCFMYKSIASESEPLLLTADEVRSNLYYIES